MVFKFDPNSTKNQGRWRLRDPDDFVSDSYITKKNDNGISYILGKLKHGDDEKFYVQAIRFEKDQWTEEEASKWWNQHKKKFIKHWKDEDWSRRRPIKVEYEEALEIAKSFARKLKIKYINPKKVTIDSKFIKDVIIPVGSLRREKRIVGDIDLLITRKINKVDLKDLKDVDILSGGNIITKLIYKGIKIDLFVFLDKNSWGPALLHYTGGFKGNIYLRQKAIKLGYKLSQNDLIDKNGKTITLKTERELQKFLGVTERIPSDRK